jgi:superfamily II DNA helicase RecQ
MHQRFFTIPVHGGAAAEEDLNRFLAGHRIVAIDRAFVQDGANSAWSLCVGFEPAGEGRPQDAKRSRSIDYREVLNEQDFAVYARLRSLRKELAEKEGVPAYAICTNEQMAEMVRRRVQTASALREIPAVGDARAEKYGEAFLKLLRESFKTTAAKPETPGAA